MERQYLHDPNAVETATDPNCPATHVVVVDDEQQTADPRRAELSPCNSGDEVGVIWRTTLDRAATVTTAVKNIVATAQSWELQQALENYLRDEIAEIERQIAADRGTGDA